jgi:hypothetical protein
MDLFNHVQGLVHKRVLNLQVLLLKEKKLNLILKERVNGKLLFLKRYTYTLYIIATCEDSIFM